MIRKAVVDRYSWNKTRFWIGKVSHPSFISFHLYDTPGSSRTSYIKVSFGRYLMVFDENPHLEHPKN